MRHAKYHVLHLFLVFLISATLLSACSGEQKALDAAGEAESFSEKIELYDAYLKDYPDGAHVNEAREQLDEALIEFARTCMNNDEGIAAYTKYLDLNSSGAHVTEAKLALAALGQGFPEAQACDTEDIASCKIIVIENERGLEHNLFRYHEWNNLLPENLACKTFEEASLFVVVREELKEIGTKQYTQGKVLHGYRRDAFVFIREAQTGKSLVMGLLNGSSPSFPSSFSTAVPDVKGSPPSYEAFEDWLTKTLSEPLPDLP